MGRWDSRDNRGPHRAAATAGAGPGGRRQAGAWPLVAAAVGSALGAMASPFWAMVGGAVGAATGSNMIRRPAHPVGRRWR